MFFSNPLVMLASKLHLAPSTKEPESSVEKKTKKDKGRKKEKKQKEGAQEIDLAKIELKSPSPLIEMERQILESQKEPMRLEYEKQLQEKINEVESKVGVPSCCGERSEYKGIQKGHVDSLFGELHILYRRYICYTCKKGIYPALRELGIIVRSWTPLVQSLLLTLDVIVPFGQGAKLAKCFWGLKVSDSGLWKLDKRTGEKIVKWEAEASQTYNNAHYELQDKDGQAPEVIEISIDGAMTLCRNKKDGSESKASLDEQDPIDPPAPPCGREVKSAVVFKPEDSVQLSEKRRALLKRTVVACLGSADVFFMLLWASLVHCGLVGPETLVVIVADGAQWIWNRASMFPNRVEILDFWHAAQHAWGCAKLLWPEQPKKIASWAKGVRGKLKEGKVEEVIQELKALMGEAKTHKFSRQAIKSLKKLIKYYTEHASRMDYPFYIQQGYRIGSGSVESLHKQLLHARMRLAGMRWSESGARCMIALRTRYLNGRWSEVDSFLSAA